MFLGVEGLAMVAEVLQNKHDLNHYFDSKFFFFITSLHTTVKISRFRSRANALHDG